MFCYLCFQIKNINKNKPYTYLSAANSILSGYKIEATNIEDSVKYLADYRKIITNPIPEIHYLYGKYYHIKESHKKAKKYYITAFKNGLKGENLQEIFYYFSKNKAFKLALKVKTIIVDEKRKIFQLYKKQKSTYKISFSWENKDKVFNSHLGEFLEKINIKGRYLEKEFLEAKCLRKVLLNIFFKYQLVIPIKYKIYENVYSTTYQ